MFTLATRELLLELIWMTFNVLTSAMKDEPVNKIIFMDEIRFKGLIDTVKLLGCFSSSQIVLPPHRSTNKVFERKSSSILNVSLTHISREKYIQTVICRTILSMATGCFDTWEVNFDEISTVAPVRKIPKIFHPTALNGLIELLPLLCQNEQSFDERKEVTTALILHMFLFIKGYARMPTICESINSETIPHYNY